MKNLTKNILGTVILLTVTSFVVNGQTNVSGGIYTNTTWTLANSPYIVTDTVVVFPNVTLTIQPGVVVKFENNIRLEIRQASLISVGTATDSITFTSNSVSPTPGIWSAVFLNASTSSKFNYCNFWYASKGIHNDQTGSTNDTLIVKNSNFNNNNWGIYNLWIGANSTIEFDSCNIINNQNGFHIEYSQTQIIVNYCNFSFNQNGYTCAGYPNNGYLKNCIVLYNQNLGIQSAHSISNSTISYNQTGISGIYGITNLTNCIVSYNTYGIQYADSVDSCTVNNNQYGVNAIYIMNSIIDSNSVVGIDYRGNVTNCEIKYNGTGITAMDSIYTITQNVIESNTIGIELGANNYIYCNKICNNTSYDLKYTISPNITVANNYWCTPDSASTSAVIYDGFDNINLGLVNFMPIDTLQCYLVTGVPVNTFQNFAFNIFPNPASNYLTVALPTNVSKTEIKIFNMLGELEYSSTATRQKTNIDISTLISGMHIIQTTGNIISRQKFIKQ